MPFCVKIKGNRAHKPHTLDVSRCDMHGNQSHLYKVFLSRTNHFRATDVVRSTASGQQRSYHGACKLFDRVRVGLYILYQGWSTFWGGGKGHRRYCGMISGPQAWKPHYVVRKFEKICCTDRVKYEGIFDRVIEERNVFHAIKWRKANWIGHILGRNCLLKHVTEGKMERTERRGRRRKHLLNGLKETRRYNRLKEEALDRTLWTRFWRSYKHLVRHSMVYLTSWITVQTLEYTYKSQ